MHMYASKEFNNRTDLRKRAGPLSIFFLVVTNSSSTKWFFQSLQNGEAQPLHYQEFSLQKDPSENHRPYKMVGARGISQTPKNHKMFAYREHDLTHSVGEMGRGIPTTCCQNPKLH